MKRGNGLRPDLFVEQLTKIEPEVFAGRPFLIVDIDNTLVLLGSAEIVPQTVTFLKNLLEKGVLSDICLVSNTGFRSKKREARVLEVAAQLKAKSVYGRGRHSKPHGRPFRQAMELMGSTKQDTIVVGDQIFTDIWGGNSQGLFTILVKPLGVDHWFTRPRRVFEKFLLKRWGKDSNHSVE